MMVAVVLGQLMSVILLMLSLKPHIVISILIMLIRGFRGYSSPHMGQEAQSLSWELVAKWPPVISGFSMLKKNIQPLLRHSNGVK